MREEWVTPVFHDKKIKVIQTAVTLLNIKHLYEISVFFSDFPSSPSETAPSLDKSMLCFQLTEPCPDQGRLPVCWDDFHGLAGWLDLGHHFLIFKQRPLKKVLRKNIHDVRWDTMPLVLEEEELHERTIDKIVCSCNKRKHIVYSDTGFLKQTCHIMTKQNIKCTCVYI